jgi:hypothetical protein
VVGFECVRSAGSGTIRDSIGFKPSPDLPPLQASTHSLRLCDVTRQPADCRLGPAAPRSTNGSDDALRTVVITERNCSANALVVVAGVV